MYVANHIKVATSTGDNDVSFEQAFSNLAHSYVREKVPTLMDKELGFQLVDRDDRSNRAAAVMAFQIGKQIGYVPLFFVDGAIKGHELLYLKDQNFVVPLKENWLNHIRNTKPRELGGPITKDLRRFGVHAPDMRSITQSPSTKWASRYNAKFLPGIAGLAKVAISDDPFPKVPTLEEFVIQEGTQALTPLLDACVKFPKLAVALSKFYDFKEMIKKANYRGCKDKGVLRKAPNKTKTYRVGVLPEGALPEDPVKSGALVVMMSRISLRAGDLTDDEKKIFDRDGIVVKDSRPDDQISTAYSEKQPFAISNPVETGIYDVLIQGGGFVKALVIVNAISGEGKHKFSTVVRLDGGKKAVNAKTCEIWVKDSAKNKNSTGPAYPSDMKALYEKAKTRPATSGGSRYVAIDDKGTGTVPFSVNYSADEVDDSVKLSVGVYYDDFCRGASDLVSLIWASPDTRKKPEYCSHKSRLTLLKNKGTGIRAGEGELFLPPDFRFIEVSDGYSGMSPSEDGSGTSKPFVLGSSGDLVTVLTEKTAGLKIYHDGSEVVINSRRMMPKQAIADLVVRYGLRESDARDMLKEAEANKFSKFRIKYAENSIYDLLNSGSISPAFPENEYHSDPMAGSMGQVTYPQEHFLPVGEPAQPSDDPMGIQALDPNLVQSLMQAAQSGQREILDTTAIASLLKSNRDDNMVGRHIGPLSNAMNHLGQLIIKFYRHGDKFEERFGKNDLAALEDSLRNNFEDLGDLILELKTKQTDPLSSAGEFIDIEDGV